MTTAEFLWLQGEDQRPNTVGKQLLQCLAGLDSEDVLRVNADASVLQSPLLQAVASERARRLVAEQEHASWRHGVSGALVLFHHLFGLLTVASVKVKLPVMAFARARVPRGRRRTALWLV